MTFMPNPMALGTTALPMAPKPTRPNVLPASRGKGFRCHVALAASFCRAGYQCAAANIKAMVCSATES